MRSALVVCLCTLIASIMLTQCRPTEDNFAMKHFLRKSRFNFKSIDNTDNPPHLKIKHASDKMIQIYEGQPLTLECEAAGNPPPKVYWMKDGERIEKSLDSGEDVISSPNQLGLSMTRGKFENTCADMNDGGVYACVADNGYSRLVAESVVKIAKSKELQQFCLQKRLADAPVVNIVMHTNTRLEYIGQSAQLYCRANGDSGVHYRWMGPEQREIEPNVAMGKYLILDNGDLIIRNLTWDDMGDYKCEATNGFYTDRTSTFLYPTLPESA